MKSVQAFFTQTPKTHGQNFRETHGKVRKLKNTKILVTEFLYLGNFKSIFGRLCSKISQKFQKTLKLLKNSSKIFQKLSSKNRKNSKTQNLLCTFDGGSI